MLCLFVSWSKSGWRKVERLMIWDDDDARGDGVMLKIATIGGADVVHKSAIRPMK
jgi:hypothetical protein